MLKHLFLLLLIAVNITVFSQTDSHNKLLDLLSHPEHSQGEMAGLMTESSVLLQTRLTLTNQKFNHDYVGTDGWARFVVYKDHKSKRLYTDWMRALAENDYVVKSLVNALEADTEYNYQLQYGCDTTNFRVGDLCKFRTLPGKDISSDVSFIVVTGMNYTKFYNWPDRKYLGADKNLGYPSAVSV